MAEDTLPAMLDDLPLNILDVSVGVGEVALELLGLRGERLAVANASEEHLKGLVRLGFEREHVRVLLSSARRGWTPNELPALSIRIVKVPTEPPTRVMACWLYRHEETITAGWAWVDVTTGVSGPEDVPMSIRERLSVEAVVAPVEGASNELVRALLNWYLPSETSSATDSGEARPELDTDCKQR